MAPSPSSTARRSGPGSPHMLGLVLGQVCEGRAGERGKGCGLVIGR